MILHDRRISSAAAMLIVFVWGCTSIPQRPGFGDVEHRIDERTGLRVTWDEQTPADGRVRETVRALLDSALTVAVAEQVALLNNHRLRAVYAELGVAQAALVQAGLLSNPVFDVVAQRGTDGGGDQLAAAVVLDFLDVFYIPLRRRLAASEFEAAKLAVTAAAMDLAFDTRIAFVSMQAEEQLLEMRGQILASTEASMTAARELLDAGNVASLDVDNQQALLDQARLDVAEAEAAVVVSRERLNRLMGLWGDDVEWQAAHRLPEVPADLPPVDLEAQAVESSVDLALARQRIESAGRRLGITERTALIPELHVGPVISREEGSTRIGATVELPLPLFDRGQAGSAKDRAVLHGLQEEYVALAVEVRSHLRSVRQQVYTAGRMARYYHEQILPVRRRITEQTLLQYNAMQIGVFRLLMAKEEEIDAGRRYIESLRNYWLTRARLEQLLRGRMPPGMADLELSTTITPTTAGEGGH